MMMMLRPQLFGMKACKRLFDKNKSNFLSTQVYMIYEKRQLFFSVIDCCASEISMMSGVGGERESVCV